MRTLARILDQPPADTALRAGGRRLTYEQLARRAAAFADELRRRELDEGGRIGIVLPPGADAPAVLLGCWMAGSVAVPLHPKSEDVDVRLRRAGVQLLVAHGDRGRSLSESMDWRGRTLLSQAPSRWAGDRLQGVFRRRSTAPEARRWVPEEPCLLLFPDCGPVAHLVGAGAVDAAVAFWRDELALSAKDRMAWTPRLPLDLAGLEALAALSAGACLFPVPADTLTHPRRLATWIQRRELTVWCDAPERVLSTLHAGLCEPEPPGDLRGLLCAGPSLDGADAVDLVRTLPWCRIWTLFDSSGALGGYELPDWFDPADLPPVRPWPSLLDGAVVERRLGLKVTA